MTDDVRRVLHLGWLPQAGNDFYRPGAFHLWLETTDGASLTAKELLVWLEQTLGRKPSPTDMVTTRLPRPCLNGKPLPSPETGTLPEGDYPDRAKLRVLRLACWHLAASPIETLNELHFRCIFQGQETRVAGDFLFWFWFSRQLKDLLLKDQYLPALRLRQRPNGKEEVYAGWEFDAGALQALLDQAVACMPPAAAMRFEPASLLRHCAEVLLHQAVAAVPVTQALEKKLEGTLLEAACVAAGRRPQPWREANPEICRAWRQWRRRLGEAHGGDNVQLCLQLHEAATHEPEQWRLELRVASRHDPSLQLALADYWAMDRHQRQTLPAEFNAGFEQTLLLRLGQAARIYPPLWSALESAQPEGMVLSLEDAFGFLTETAWVLEDAGFRVIVPAWWTPQGQRRARLRLRGAPAGRKATKASGGSSLSLNQLIQYRYDLALGGDVVSEEEWLRLVESKTPLVQFRGQWVALDRGKMLEMLAFWKRQSQEPQRLDVLDLLQRTADETTGVEVDPDDALYRMLAQLRDHSRLEAVDDPPGLGATLRDYQRRGVAWIQYLEHLDLNGCLADDMGLGKTIQVIARLLTERAGGEEVDPTLLVAPTSVLGNWRQEIERFAPHLRALLHHGGQRHKDQAAFQEQAGSADLVIVSYNLLLRDAPLFGARSWRRVVLDEAQNIKNPEAKQTKAILKLDAKHRLTLTGTPVENRLLDLWSIFNFLNPGYLGKQAQFRRVYETPIQRERDPAKSALLKRLVEPFILRRVKTDPSVVKDLPAKVENRQYCNLGKEQAALYEAVIRDVERQLAQTEGIQRKGLMLSTLMKLKQICNHPAQFLQDNSAFTTQRSHKLERLGDMLGDVVAEGESALVFTQFTEIGERLERHLQHALQCRTFYLHGGTPRHKREDMITRFQEPQGDPAVFVLSLKAGGVGITLTRANHVFHFDRWWNPAVEDQATDRAFRIGQTKNVFVHTFITLGSLEERIDQMIEDKKRVAGSIVGSDESWLSNLDDETFKALIALNREAVLEQ
jgi:SNF2 family DNA or RNA helicase